MPKRSNAPLQVLRPTGARGPTVLVIHSWWGLTPSFVAFGEALARKGFVVGLTDLFDGQTAADAEEAKRLRRAPRREPMYKMLIRNIEELQACDAAVGPDVGIVGFSMGGHWAVWLSQRPELPIRATVLYYAVRAGSFGDSHSSFVAHYAESDPWVKPAARRRMEVALAKAGRPYQAFDYPGTQHWFAESDRVEDYAPEAAETALERTAAYLKESLGRR